MAHDGIKGWIFDLACPGYALSVPHKRLLLSGNATLNWDLGFEDVCKEKYVYVAYNHEVGIFEVSNITGKMLETPAVNPYVQYWPMAYDWEIQKAFFETYNIKPTWLNANYTWGWLDNVTNTWTGAVGMIERDEADYAICCFAGTYGRSKVAAFSPGIDYSPLHWLTRYPLELPPTWNLLGLFTKGCLSQMSFP